MLKTSIYRIAVFATVATLVACANPGIVEVAPDTYLIARSDKGGIFGNAPAMRAGVIREADKFAAAKGKAAIQVSLRETPMRPGRFAKIEYEFRLVDRNNPPESASDGTEKTKDVYAELIKLDDLRERGILTQAEFDAEKKKLLEGH